MALTTSEELQKQLTVIFGFNGQLNIEVGHIIGIGKLSAQHTTYLIKQVLNFLNAYNGMLRDYAGCELYSIQFELENLNKEKDQLKIMPREMVLIPGEYKDCNTLLLLLSHEMSLLDNHRAKEAIDNIGKLYFEVEEIAQRPELNSNDQWRLLNSFAERFALKLQGNVIDGKWNRKLVGLKTTDSNEEHGANYLSGNIKTNIRWDKEKEIAVSNPRFTQSKLSWSEEDLFEFAKHQILPSAAYVITQNTFKLTASLLQIANSCTINDTQNQILVVILNNYLEYASQTPALMSIDAFKHHFDQYLGDIRDYLEDFRQKGENFSKTGKIGSLEELTDAFLSQFPKETGLKPRFLHYLSHIVRVNLKTAKYDSITKVRVGEFQSTIYYILQTAQMVIKAIKETIPCYFQHFLLMKYGNGFIQSMNNELKTQRKPVQALGAKYIQKFADFLANHIAYDSTSNSKACDVTTQSNQNPKPEAMKQTEIFQNFKKTIQNLIEPFIADVEIDINDVLGFVETMLSDVPATIQPVKNLLRFKSEIEFLWGNILRSSTINRFIRDFDPAVELTPLTFTAHFLEFLRKRLGSIELIWRDYVFQWISEYGKLFQLDYDSDKAKKRMWPKTKVIELFIKYINEKIEHEMSLEGFKNPLDTYVNKVAYEANNPTILEIIKTYQMCLEIITQFGDYISQIVSKAIVTLEDPLKTQSIPIFLGPIPSIGETLEDAKPCCEKDGLNESSIGTANEHNSNETEAKLFKLSSPKFGKEGLFDRLPFYDYILQIELKYFSKLIAKPVIVELRTTDRESFRGESLIHRIEYRYWDKFMKMFLSSNYQDVKTKF